MSIPKAGQHFRNTVALGPALGFVPIAVHFDLFSCLQEIGKPATAQDVCGVHMKKYGASNLYDTLFVMGGLGYIDLLPGDVYAAKEVTEYLVATPSAQHGALHLLLASAFLMKRLEDTNFAYPFKECETPIQYAYKLLDSFNTFMTGKFGRCGTMPDRARALGYDLDGLISSTEHPIIVDGGGVRGRLLLELKAAYSNSLGKDSLVLQEYNAEIGAIPDITVMTWNYKEDGNEQPVKGALIYSLANVLHNLSDSEATKLLRKMARAMIPSSRFVIQESTKKAGCATTHAAMIIMHAGKERTAAEWRELAASSGLKVTFEAYPPVGKCLVEMMKVSE
ncbi:uncharacterized protein P174DRAFT_464645 [Aspergillus novofumigatus IBT 16806]|uniref:O-methyltransferase C-terminal domain-containing protein n=1 Tax=Aspergillus novofumigatus (strain IBT 16806) TaxID=1392255 RepID=A0A2I1BU27_ASPN1|nr:uncharacterized protein P174DRAFT_464645 [Aspergillus novofumigatus IBT 16806]PKX88907.1 hypothetical protein P174DRAFT_464645 [Aspergillus novofumigatus IBT 16806]